jgi:hypothetical protein
LEKAVRRTSNARAVILWLAAAQSATLVIAGCYLWIRVFYLGDADAVNQLSYHAADTPPVPQVPWTLGVHSFGDFLLPYEQAAVANPWVDYKIWANPYPSTLVTFFKLLTLFPYRVALAVFFALTAASMAIPVFIASRRFTIPIAILAMCLLVFLSFPFAMVIDRGNAQGLIVLPLYIFTVAWREARWRTAAFSLAAAIAFKLYPAVLVIGLLAERRYRDAFTALAIAGGVTVFLFALYPDGFITTFEGFLSGLARFSAPSISGFTIGNYSIVGMTANVAYGCCGPGAPVLVWIAAHPWWPGILYFFAVTAVVFARRLPFVVRMACAMSLLTLAIPLSYGYSLVFVVVVVAELLRGAALEGPDSELAPPLAVALAVAVAATLAPLPMRVPITNNSIGTIVVPASWVALTVTALIYRFGGARRLLARRAAA